MNASIGKSVLKRVGSVENVTLDEAVELLRKKAERPPRTRGRFAKKTKKKQPKEPKAEKAKKTKKKTKEKKPEVPGMKKPLSAFFAFSADERAAVKTENPSFTVGEVAKALGERWAALDADRKSAYERNAKEAKEAYAIALAEHLKTLESSTTSDDE